MKQMLGEVTANVELCAGLHLLRVHAPEIAAHAAAGQFVHVRCNNGTDPYLRRPLSIARVADAAGRGRGGAAREEIALLVAAVGKGSALVAASRVADRLDLLGPLGRGFALHPKARQVLLVAGGVGIAPLLALTEQALDREMAVTMLFGARNAAQVFPATMVRPEVEYIVLTDDGSQGQRGLVTDAMSGFLDYADQVFACGPMPMLRAVAETLPKRAWGIPDSTPPFAQVSIEQHMGCAMGACYGCVIDTVNGHRRVCRDGPVFDLSEVKWW